jgi:hypothetical protein
MEIDQDRQTRLMNDVKAISFPRLVGTEGELRAREWIKSQIKSIGYEYTTQPFQANYYRSNGIPRISNSISAILFLISALFFDIHPLLFCIPLIAIFILIYLMSTGSIEIGQQGPKFLKNYDTENIIVQTPRKAENIDIIFMGHFDSKSSVLSGSVRFVLYDLMMFGALGILIIGIVGVILFLASISIPSFIFIAMWIIASISAVSGFGLLFNAVGNKSPGASDNGTACAILLELLRFYKTHSLPNANLTFLFTSAEETGITGSYYYAKRLNDDTTLNKKKVFVINWDLAGLKGNLLANTGVGIPKRLTSPKMAKFLDEISHEHQLPLKQAYLPIGGWTDALAFSHYGFDAISLSGKSGKIHTYEDTPDLIDPTNLYYNCMLGVELTKKMANNPTK